jgi:antitoxin PrlF
MGYTLTTKSQVTLPKAIREHLKVAPGDAVEFRIVADGSVRVLPATPARGGVDAKGAAALAKYRKLIGMARTGTSTDEWMNLLRGYDEDADDPGFARVEAAAPLQPPRKPVRKLARKAPR